MNMLQNVLHWKYTQRIITFVILLNAAVLGLLTNKGLSAEYGDAFPELFGDIGDSIFTLFQVMTFESWATAVARPIMEVHPYAWVFFLVFILLTSITLLNVMVGIVVEAVAQISEANRQKQLSVEAKDLFSDVRDTEKIDKEIREHIAKIEELLKARGHTQKTEVAE